MCYQWNPIITDIANCARRMVVPIKITQILISDNAMLKYVINYSTGALSFNAFAQPYKLGIK